jgi:hypothetical protein
MFDLSSHQTARLKPGGLILGGVEPLHSDVFIFN